MKSSGIGRLLVLLTSLVLLLAACGGDGETDGAATEAAGGGDDTAAEAEETEIERGNVVIGSTNFPEQEIVAEMYALVLEDAGYSVERRYQLGSREVVFPALQGGELDVTPEYVGTLLEFINGGAGEATSDTEETLGLLNERLEEGVTMLEPSDAEDKNALALTQETAGELGATTVSDLEGQAGELVLGGPPECPQRPLCLPGYEETYGLEFANFQALDAGGPLTTEALNQGDIDVGLVFSTQGAIAANDWVVLEDDQGLQPAENITPAVREDILNGEVEELLNGVSAALTTEKVIELNRRVDVDREAPADVALDFVEQEGILGGAGGDSGTEPATTATEASS
ncbi:MAG TPA: ABC transporter substrate-binding protein [Euzebyales bacterium]|nr:ABC transporter substrate-binding protein [Euzebyales bacterium]